MRPEAEIIAVAHDWDRAMVQNDADAIGRYMAEDWIIVGSDGNICDKATFLGLIGSGTLTHDVMESHDINVRLYGDSAVVVGRGVSAGVYQRVTFRMAERVSCVFVKQQGTWKCVLTHLSLIADK